MRVELVESQRGRLVEINLGKYTIHSITEEEARTLAGWILELLPDKRADALALQEERIRQLEEALRPLAKKHGLFTDYSRRHAYTFWVQEIDAAANLLNASIK